MKNIITTLENQEKELYAAMKAGKISTSEYESAATPLLKRIKSLKNGTFKVQSELSKQLFG